MDLGESDPLQWWTISGSEFLRALRLVAEGSDPEMVYTEFYANSDHEHHGGTDA